MDETTDHKHVLISLFFTHQSVRAFQERFSGFSNFSEAHTVNYCWYNIVSDLFALRYLELTCK